MMELKIAILTPMYGPASGKWMQSLANALKFFYEEPIVDPDGEPCDKQAKLFIVSSSMLTESRHKLVADAVFWGATHFLWLDADHTFPEDTIHRLLAHNLPIVGANYSRRCIPTAPTAALLDGKGLCYTTRAKAEAGELEQVAHIGFGVCLIDARVLDALQLHAEAVGADSYLPLFHMEVKPNGGGIIGEDTYFFRKCRDAGMQVFVDHALSWEVGHLSDVVMTSGMAVQQREAWEGQTEAMKARYEARAKEAEEAHQAQRAALEGAADNSAA
jgi:hypothetical protein